MINFPDYVEWLVSLSWFDLGKSFWTGVGFCAGLIGAARLNKWNLRSSNSFVALSQLTQSGSQATAYSKTLRFMCDHPGSDPIPHDHVKSDPSIEEQVLIMLGMYQFLAFSVQQKLLDRELVIRLSLLSMHSFITKLKPTIDDYRIRLNRPTAWRELEEFVAEETRKRLEKNARQGAIDHRAS